MVKLEPRPTSLSTVMSPPIIWQNRRLITRPRPVPPYFRVVDASACENSWNNLTICSGVMPMPVSATAMVLPPPRMNRDGAALRELVGIAHEIEQRLPQPHRVGMQRPDRPIAEDHELIAILRRQRLDCLDHALDERRKREIFELQLHPTGLDLGEVEDVVDQSEQVTTSTEHAVKRLSILLCCLRILPKHLGDADDGVERRAQLMAHVGEKLRLVLARLRELPALFLDFIE